MKKQITSLKLTKINAFWKFFNANEALILASLINNDQTNPVFAILNQKMEQISKRIGFIISQSTEEQSKRGHVTITANGYPSLRYLVQAIVAHAPHFEIFEINAFIQPLKNFETIINGNDQPFSFEDFEYKISDLYFLPTSHNNNQKKISITVFLPNYNIHFDHYFLETAIQIIIESIVGEFAARKSFTEIKLAQTPRTTDTLVPLYQINEYIDFINKLNKRVKFSL
jgi:hypothetical protein